MSDKDSAGPLERTVGRLQARADNAYIEYIARLRRDECLGWEIKAKRGKFGEPELKAHTAAAEMLGRHRALSEAAEMLRELDASIKQDQPPNTR